MPEVMSAAPHEAPKGGIVYRCPQCGSTDTVVRSHMTHRVECPTCTNIAHVIDACTGRLTAYEIAVSDGTRRPRSRTYGSDGYTFTMPGFCDERSCEKKSVDGPLGAQWTSEDGAAFVTGTYKQGREYCKIHHPKYVYDRSSKREAKRRAKQDEARNARQAVEDAWAARLNRAQKGEGTDDDWKMIRASVKFGYWRTY